MKYLACAFEPRVLAYKLPESAFSNTAGCFFLKRAIFKPLVYRIAIKLVELGKSPLLRPTINPNLPTLSRYSPLSLRTSSQNIWFGNKIYYNL